MNKQFSTIAILAILGMLQFGCSSDGVSTTQGGGAESDASLSGIGGEGEEGGPFRDGSESTRKAMPSSTE